MNNVNEHIESAVSARQKRVRRRRLITVGALVVLVATFAAIAPLAFTATSDQARELGITAGVIVSSDSSTTADDDTTVRGAAQGENVETSTTDDDANVNDADADSTLATNTNNTAASTTPAVELTGEASATAGKQGDLEFATFHDDAAVSAEAARQALADEQGWPEEPADINAVVDAAFDEGTAQAQETGAAKIVSVAAAKVAAVKAAGVNPSPKALAKALSTQSLTTAAAASASTLARQADGTQIERFDVKWATSDSEPHGKDWTSAHAADDLLYVRAATDADFDQYLIAQVTYSLSGEHDYEPGDIRITVPAHIFKNRSGKWADVMVIPMPEAPKTGGDFNWQLMRNDAGEEEYVLTNTRKMSAATKGFVQFGISRLTPHEIKNMQESEPFVANIEVTTHRGTLIGLTSNEITAQIDTAQIATEIVKDASNSRMGYLATKASLEEKGYTLPAGAPDSACYVIVNWYMRVKHQGNQEFTLDIADQLTDSYNGFILQADKKDVQSRVRTVNQRVFDGWEKDGWTSYYYITSAYPFYKNGDTSQYTFEPDKVHKLTNTVNYTLTEKDSPSNKTTLSATAYANYEWHNPRFDEPYGHFNVFKWGNDGEDAKTESGKASPYLDHGLTTEGLPTESTFNPDYFYNGKYPYNHFGVYPEALNQLAGFDGEPATDVDVAYTVETDAFVFPWTAKAGAAGTALRKLSTYGQRSVVTQTWDTGLSFGPATSEGTALTPITDYTFKQLEIPRPLVGYAEPNGMDDNGNFVVGDAASGFTDGSFNYRALKDYSGNFGERARGQGGIADEPIVLDVEVRNANGTTTWQNGYAKIYWDADEARVVYKDGTVDSGPNAHKITKLPSNMVNFRTVVTTKHAYYHHYVLPTITLKKGGKAGTLARQAFGTDANPEYGPMLLLRNGIKMQAFDPTGKRLVNLDKKGIDRLNGFRIDTMALPSKEGSFEEVKDANGTTLIGARVTYKAKAQFQTFIADKATYEKKRAQGKIPTITSGVWYDLLPPGMYPDLSTVKLRKGDSILAAYTLENYNGSGRVLLVVKAKLETQPQAYDPDVSTTTSDSKTFYYEDAPSITFEADYSVDAYNAHGQNAHNVVAFEAVDNDFIGTVPGFKGEPGKLADNKSDRGNTETTKVYDNSNSWERKALNALNEDGHIGNKKNFLYADDYMKIDIPGAARSGLAKDVSTNGDGYWTSGKGKDPVNQRYVYEDGTYAYRLMVGSGPETSTHNIIIYDTLESFVPSMYDPQCEDAHDKQWHGELTSVDVTQLEQAGCAPVVYYSTLKDPKPFDTSITDAANVVSKGQGPALSDEGDPNKMSPLYQLTSADASKYWVRADQYKGSLSDVTMVAIDARKAADGSDFVLMPEKSIVAYLHMHAPNRTDNAQGENSADFIAAGAHAYNNVYFESYLKDETTGKVNDVQQVRYDYTKVGLKGYEVGVTKVWNDDNDRDRVRPNPAEAVLHLWRYDPETDTSTDMNRSIRLRQDGYYEGNGAKLVTDHLNLETNEIEDLPDWTGYFTGVPATNPHGVPYSYSVVEDGIDFVKDGVHGSYTTEISLAGDNAFTVTNTHEPFRTSVEGTKTWRGDGDDDLKLIAPEGSTTDTVRPKFIQVRLYKNGTYDQTKTVKPDADGNWHYSFGDLKMFEDGKLIDWTVEERVSDSNYITYLYDDEGELAWATDLTPVEAARKIVEGEKPSNPKGFNIANFYHPYGTVSLAKTVSNATSQVADRSFDFKAEFTRDVLADELDANGNPTGNKVYKPEPLTGTFNYKVFARGADNSLPDETVPASVVREGSVASGGIISLKANEYARVYYLPAGAHYAFSEIVPDGFSTRGASSVSGDVSPNYSNPNPFKTGKNAALVENVYSTQGNAYLTADKLLHGKMRMRNYEFSFELDQVRMGEDGAPFTDDDEKRTVGVAYSRAVADDDPTDLETAGKVAFGALSYSNAGSGGVDGDAKQGWCVASDDGKTWTYYYEMRETDRGRAGYAYDLDTRLRVRVDVSDNGDGTMSTAVTYYYHDDKAGEWKQLPAEPAAPGDEATDQQKAEYAQARAAYDALRDERAFRNVYSADGDFTLRAWKQLEGRALKAGEFSFQLLDRAGNALYAQKANEDGGKLRLVDLSAGAVAEQDGKFMYTPEADGADPVEVVPLVAKNDAEGAIVFGPVKVDIDQLHRDAANGVCKFQAADEEAGIDADTWTYYFFARELKGEDATVSYDETLRAYRITVTDNGNGSLATVLDFLKAPDKLPVSDEWSATETNDLPIFKNTLAPGKLEVSKTAKWDAALAPEGDQDFHFRLKLLGEQAAKLEGLTYVMGEVGDDEGDLAGIEDALASGEVTPVSDDGGETNGEGQSPVAQLEQTIVESTPTLVQTIDVKYNDNLKIDFYDDGTICFRPVDLTRDCTLNSYDSAQGEYRAFNFSGADDGTSAGDKNASLLYIRNKLSNPSNYTELKLRFAPGCKLVGEAKFTERATPGSVLRWRLVDVDFTNLDMTGVTSLSSAFSKCDALKRVVFPEGATSTQLTRLSYLFEGCTSLETIDLSGLNTTNASFFVNMFGATDNSIRSLRKMTLGQAFSFKGVEGSPATPPRPYNHYDANGVSDSNGPNPYPGNWVNEETGEVCSQYQLRDKGIAPGTWVPYVDGATVSLYSYIYSIGLNGSYALAPSAQLTDVREVQTASQSIDEPYTVPDLPREWKSPYVRFIGWHLPEAQANKLPDASVVKVPDAQATQKYSSVTWNIVKPGTVVPAGTMAYREKWDFSAIFQSVARTATLKDGELDFYLKGGEKATFEDIPAGTVYQVWEETPSGWELVEQSGVAGDIEPLKTARASFANEYKPGTTSAQFAGTKTMDGVAAAEGAYSFQLTPVSTTAADMSKADMPMPAGEGLQGTGDARSYVMSNGAGGFVQFPAITYLKAGEYRYRLCEVVPEEQDGKITYDPRTWDVVVAVEDDGEGNLTTTTAYSADGVQASSFSFANTSVPGSLRVAKVVDDGSLTDANKDAKFTFKLRFYAANGLPAASDSGFEWYAHDQQGNIVSEGVVVAEEDPDVPNNPDDPGEPERPEGPADNAAWETYTDSGSSVKWMIDDGGVLWVKALDGSQGVLSVPHSSDNGNGPWYGKSFKQVRVAAGSTIKVTNTLASVFRGCSSLESFYGAGFDVSAVKDFSRAFRDCSKLKIIDVSSWNFQSATAFNGMFYGCASLENVDFSRWNVSNVTTTQQMFMNCTSLANVDLSGWSTAANGDSSQMFANNNSLTSISLGPDFKVTDTVGMRLDYIAPNNTRKSGGWRLAGTSNALQQAESSFAAKGTVGSNAGTWVWMLESAAQLQTQGISTQSVQSTQVLAMPTEEEVELVADDEGVAQEETASSGNVVKRLSARVAAALSTQSAEDEIDLDPAPTPPETGWTDITNNGNSTSWAIDAEGILWFKPTSGSEGVLKGEDWPGWTMSDDGRDLVKQVRVVAGTTIKLSGGCAKYAQSGREPIGLFQVFGNLIAVHGDATATNGRFDTSNVTDLSGLVQGEPIEYAPGCSLLKELHISTWDVSNVQSMRFAFYKLDDLHVLDLSGWSTPKLQDAMMMLSGARGFTQIVFGPGFHVPQFSSTATNNPSLNEKWVRSDGLGPLTGDELMWYGEEAQERREGVWERVVDEKYAEIELNANGGSCKEAKITVEGKYVNGVYTFKEQELPDCSRPGYVFLGWHKDGDPESKLYVASDVVQPIGGKRIRFTARWAKEGLMPVIRVEHYEQIERSGSKSYDVPTFSSKPAAISQYVAMPGTTFTAPVMEAFSSAYDLPELQTIEVGSSLETITVKYFYLRSPYRIIYKGNGATAGYMPDQEAYRDATTTIADNRYVRAGYIFVGWNTSAKGDGKNYAPGASVKNLGKSGESCTLYAKWLANANEAMKPSKGETTVTLKAGQTLVFPNLPVGVRYEIEEVDMPTGWSFDNAAGEVSEEGSAVVAGAIEAADADVATYRNAYDASGSVSIVAHKRLDGGTMAEGQFTFALGDPTSQADDETAANGAEDTFDTWMDDDGNEVSPNPFKGTALVRFADKTFTLSDVRGSSAFRPVVVAADGTYVDWQEGSDAPANGWVATMTVRELAGDDATIVYDNAQKAVDVLVTDNGNGTLSCKAIYPKGENDGHGVTFVNSVKPGSLEVSKELVGAVAGTAAADKAFTFDVELYDAGGNELAGSFPVEGGAGDDGVSHGGTIVLKGGQTVRITGLPAGAAYRLTERDEPGYTLTGAAGETGSIAANETSQASFVNSYDAAGSVPLTASKALVKLDGDGNVDGDEFTPASRVFSFTLLDSAGNVVESGVPNTTGGLVSFVPLQYSLADLEGGTVEGGTLSKTFEYTIIEVAGGYRIHQENAPEGVYEEPDADEAKNMVYDTHEERVRVTVTDDGTGELKTDVTYVDDAADPTPGAVKFVNKIKPKVDEYHLPHSGGMGTRLFTAIGVGVMIAAGLAFVIRRRVHHHHDLHEAHRE